MTMPQRTQFLKENFKFYKIDKYFYMAVSNNEAIFFTIHYKLGKNEMINISNKKEHGVYTEIYKIYNFKNKKYYTAFRYLKKYIGQTINLNHILFETLDFSTNFEKYDTDKANNIFKQFLNNKLDNINL